MPRKIFSSNLLKTASVYTIGRLINSAIPFLLLPILTRYLNTEEYGQLSMFNATVSFLVPFVGMSVGTAIQRKMVEGNDEESKEYIYNCLLILLTSTVLTAVVVFLFSDLLSKYTTIPKKLLSCVVVTTSGSCLFGAALSFYQIKNKPKIYSVLQNSCTFFNAVLSIILIVFGGMKLSGRIYGITYSTLLFAVVSSLLFYRFISRKGNKVNKNYIKDEIYNFALPLIPIEIKSTVLTYMDRVFLANMVNVATTGVYSLGNQVSLPLLFIAQSFNLAFVPWLFMNLKENSDEKKRKIVKISYIYFAVAILVAVVWSLFSKTMISIITDTGYENAHVYVLWLSLGYAFTGMQMMVVNYIYYSKKLNVYATITTIIMVLNLIFNYVLIKEDGPVGAAEATLICNIISFLSTWVISIKIYPMPWLYFLRRKNN